MKRNCPKHRKYDSHNCPVCEAELKVAIKKRLK